MQEGGIQTTTNEAYEKTKESRIQGGDYEMINIPETVSASKGEMCESPSATTSLPLPAIPTPTSDKENEEEDVVYEAIPGDN